MTSRAAFLSAALCCGLACAEAQTTAVPAAERKGFSALNEPALREGIGYLASDKLAGRMSLQPGDEAAERWVAEQFAKAGLKPLATGADGKPSFYQNVELMEYRADRANTSVTFSRGGAQTILRAPMASAFYKQAVDITAPVVFAGYGITAPELGYDDYKGIDAAGKIVVVFDHEPQEDDPRSIFNGTGNTRYATSRVKLLNAQAHGAVAVLIAPEPNRKHLTNAERSARIGGSVTRAMPLPLQAIADDELHIPGGTLNDDGLAQLLSTAGKNGHALQAAIDKDLAPQSTALPETTMTLHLRNSSERRGTTASILGLLEGSDPKLKAETILISGHHDHDGEAPCPAPKPDGTAAGGGAGTYAGIDEAGKPTLSGAQCMQIWHGADDNASGSVGVVELAKAFAANGARPKRSILFAVFASEERGLLGAYYLAQHPLRPLATLRAQINFDMIGRDEKPSPQTDGLIEIPADTTNRLNLIGALYSPEYNKAVAEENKHVGLTLDDRFDHDAVLNVFFRSDQFPFVLHNVPAFWWFTGFHPDYHHTSDTAEKIDYAKMKRILQLAYLTAWRFADDAHTPAFVANPQPAGGGQAKAGR